MLSRTVAPFRSSQRDRNGRAFHQPSLCVCAVPNSIHRYGGSLGPAQAITDNAEKQKKAIEEKDGKPELYPLQKKRQLTQEEEEDEMWLATKKGLNLAQIVPLRCVCLPSSASQRGNVFVYCV